MNVQLISSQIQSLNEEEIDVDTVDQSNRHHTHIATDDNRIASVAPSIVHAASQSTTAITSPNHCDAPQPISNQGDQEPIISQLEQQIRERDGQVVAWQRELEDVSKLLQDAKKLYALSNLKSALKHHLPLSRVQDAQADANTQLAQVRSLQKSLSKLTRCLIPCTGLKEDTWLSTFEEVEDAAMLHAAGRHGFRKNHNKHKQTSQSSLSNNQTTDSNSMHVDSTAVSSSDHIGSTASIEYDPYIKNGKIMCNGSNSCPYRIRLGGMKKSVCIQLGRWMTTLFIPVTSRLVQQHMDMNM